MLGVIFGLLGRAIKCVYKIDDNAKNIFNNIGVNFVVQVKIIGIKKTVFFWLEEGNIKYCKNKKIKADLTLTVISVAMAKQVFFSKITPEEAFAKNFFIIQGDISKAVLLVDLFNLVLSYLYSKNKVKSPVTLQSKRSKFFAKILFV
ncbi:MAG: SCP2 sterol-binding domain-containing protein [Clostridia bacterium]